MSHEIENKPVAIKTESIRRWLRKVFVANKRISIPITAGVFAIVSTQLIPATSSSFLWFLHSWGAYIGAMMIAYGLFPLVVNLDDDNGGDAPPPPHRSHE